MKKETFLLGIFGVVAVYLITQKSGLIIDGCKRTYIIDEERFCNNELPTGYHEIKYGNNYFVLPHNKYQEFQQLIAAQQQYAQGQGAGTISALTTFGAFLEQYSPQLIGLVTELNSAGYTGGGGAGSGGGTGGSGAYTEESGCPPGTTWNSITESCI